MIEPFAINCKGSFFCPFFFQYFSQQLTTNRGYYLKKLRFKQIFEIKSRLELAIFNLARLKFTFCSKLTIAKKITPNTVLHLFARCTLDRLI